MIEISYLKSKLIQYNLFIPIQEYCKRNEIRIDYKLLCFFDNYYEAVSILFKTKQKENCFKKFVKNLDPYFEL